MPIILVGGKIIIDKQYTIGMENMNKIYVSFEEMRTFMEDAFVRVGVPFDDAKTCANVLLESDLRGIDSHGVNRFKVFYIDRILNGIQEAVTHLEVVKETATTAVIDGHNGMGMVIATKAMTMAIEKAKVYGLGMVVVRHSTHYGFAGYYPLMAVKEGLIGMTGTNARPAIAPTFGVSNMLGTNPLTFAMPTDEAFPFFFDAATSIVQRGKIEYYMKNGLDTPEGLVVDKAGQTLTDSKKILERLVKNQAALAPLGGIGEAHGGHKGYGFATVVEILSSALQSGAFLHMLSGVSEDGGSKPIPVGHFFLAINPDFFMGLEAFKKTAGDILRSLRSSEVAPGEAKIYTAGEKEYLHSLERKETGIPLNDVLTKELIDVRDQLKINHIFSFET